MVGNKHVIRKKVVYYTIFLLPSEISNESPDGVSPGLWVHPGVLAKVLHYMEVGASLLTQPCACVRERERKGGGGNRREYNTEGANNPDLCLQAYINERRSEAIEDKLPT